MSSLVSIGDMNVIVHGNGPTIVMCHGFTTTGMFWREQIEPFSATHRLIVIDLPGHGKSPRPTGRSYTMDAFVADMELVFRTLAIEDAVLIGLSMGGTIAQQFALKNPALLKGLVLVGATAHGLGDAVKVENVIEAIRRLGVAEASQVVIDRSFASYAPPELVQFAKEEVTQTPDFVAREAIVSLNLADSRSRLAEIAMPTLVVCGDEDLITPPAESRTLADKIPNAQLFLVAKAGHFPMLECPSEFNAALRTFVDHLAAWHFVSITH